MVLHLLQRQEQLQEQSRQLLGRISQMQRPHRSYKGVQPKPQRKGPHGSDSARRAMKRSDFSSKVTLLVENSRHKSRRLRVVQSPQQKVPGKNTALSRPLNTRGSASLMPHRRFRRFPVTGPRMATQARRTPLPTRMPPPTQGRPLGTRKLSLGSRSSRREIRTKREQIPVLKCQSSRRVGVTAERRPT